MESVVVLPAPLGPTMPNSEPARTSSSMESAALVLPKDLLRSVTESAMSRETGCAAGDAGAARRTGAVRSAVGPVGVSAGGASSTGDSSTGDSSTGVS